jgi:hypothetical protein
MAWNRMIVGMGVGVALLGLTAGANAQQAQPSPQAAKPPVMQHTAQGRAQCLMCHGGTMPNIKAAPKSHEGRGNEICLSCHAKEAAIQTKTPPGITHVVKGREQCLMCHAGTMPNIKGVPEDHKGVDVKYCTLCHTAAAPAPK